MKKNLLFLLLVLLLCSHDMYLKLDSYFLPPDTQSQIQLFNGTFEKSENVIDRDRMMDASLVGNNNRITITEDQWTEMDSITYLNFTTGKAGTWVAGVSTKARNIEMAAQAFNDYLEHDGVQDMLESRRENNLLEQNAVEKYSKHVKVIFQVGDSTTGDWSKPLGYPIEFIPQSNPYELHTGDGIVVKLLRDGNPLVDQLVYADSKPSNNSHSHEVSEEMHSHGNEKPHSHGQADNHKEQGDSHEHPHTHDDGQQHSHDHEHDAAQQEDNHEHEHGDTVSNGNDATEKHTHTTGQELRTNESGEVTVKLNADGIYYLRTIHLVNTEEEGLTHESNWATLTFEIAHSHENEHSHEHDDEGIPMWIFITASIIIVGGLFFFFNRKK